MANEEGGPKKTRKARDTPPEVMELSGKENPAETPPVDPSKLSREELLSAYHSLSESTRRLRDLFAKSREISSAQRGRAEDAEESAMTDPLTGLGNKRALEGMLVQEAAASWANRAPFTVVMIDVDRFKAINDSFGHLAGDKTLKRIADAVNKTKRGDDAAFRYGGEEFMVVLPGTDGNGGLEFAKRLKQNIAKTVFEFDKVKVGAVTVSIGIATYPDRGSMFQTPPQGDLRGYYRQVGDALTKASDAAVYEAKGDGRNAVRIAPTLDSTKVGEIAGKMAIEMGLSEKDVEDVRKAARYHDIGKMKVPDSIVSKNGRLTPGEAELMREHARDGEAIALELGLCEKVVKLIGCHHERFDGRGYPSNLRGVEIPLGARIISVADAFEAMVGGGRGYSSPMTVAQAVKELKANSGTQFDPAVVAALVRLVVGNRI